MTSEIAATASSGASRADLPQLPIFSAEYQADPRRYLREALEQSPIATDPFGFVALSYDTVRTVLRDRRFRRPDALGLGPLGVTSGPLWDWAAASLLSLDGEEHRRLRKLVLRAFTPASAAKLNAAMIEVITGLTDPVATTGGCDIVADVARPYPIPIVCELLGAPREDWRLFSAWTDDIFKMFTLNVAADAPDILRALDGLSAYVDQLVERRRQSLSDDLLSNLIRAEDGGDRLTHDELLMMAATVLVAGTDTTRNQLAAAVEVFCAYPDQWAMLAAQPELALRAVEEVMRHTPVVPGVPRIAGEDVELDGVVIPAGALIFAAAVAANRDPSVYPDPDRFDITRDGPEPMLTFGGGLHYCLGVHLAKAELAAAFTILPKRMPNIRRVGPAPWKQSFAITGPITLPVEFDAGH